MGQDIFSIQLCIVIHKDVHNMLQDSTTCFLMQCKARLTIRDMHFFNFYFQVTFHSKTIFVVPVIMVRILTCNVVRIMIKFRFISIGSGKHFSAIFLSSISLYT